MVKICSHHGHALIQIIQDYFMEQMCLISLTELKKGQIKAVFSEENNVPPTVLRRQACLPKF